MVLVSCAYCGKQVKKKPSRVKAQRRFFCNRYHARLFVSLEHRMDRPLCLNGCGNLVNKKGSKFCSHSCHLDYMWKTKWAPRMKEPLSPWRKRQQGKEQVIIRVPTVVAADFAISLKELVNEFNSKLAYSGVGVIEVRHGRNVPVEVAAVRASPL